MFLVVSTSAIYCSWQCIKKFKKSDPLLLLFFYWFWIPLLCLSLAKHKYSHYLILIYPAMAALAGYTALKLSKKWKQYLHTTLKIFSLILALILLIFPITTNIRRDVNIFKILNLTEYLPSKPKHWIIVNDSLPYFNTAGVLAWEKDIPVSRVIDTEITHLKKKNILLIVRKKLWKKWQNDKNYKNRWKAFAIFVDKNLVVLLDKNLWNSKEYFLIQ